MDNRYIIAKLALTYKNESTNELEYVKKALLSGLFNENNGVLVNFFKSQKILEFVKNSRDAIVKDSGVDIAFIDDELVYPQRNNLDNFIIIPISLAFVIALVVFNFICQRKK